MDLKSKITDEIWEIQASIRMLKREKRDKITEIETRIYEKEQQLYFLEELIK